MFPQRYTTKRYLTVQHEALVRSHLAWVRAAEQRAAGRGGGGVFKHQVHDDHTHRQTACKSHAMHANATCVLFPLYYTDVCIHYLSSVTVRIKRLHRACRVTQTQTQTDAHTRHVTSSATSWNHHFPCVLFFFFNKKESNISEFSTAANRKGVTAR